MKMCKPLEVSLPSFGQFLLNAFSVVVIEAALDRTRHFAHLEMRETP
jgi:hypothetical protein